MANLKTKTKKKSGSKTKTKSTQQAPFAHMTESALQDYFVKLNGTIPGDLYGMVLSEVERPLFQKVMEYTDGNQSRAAEILGINRGTLRKKLKTYALD
ncbi:MAG: DNA-binding transcriptional regulator Fis [Woeseiaceae bacterium]